MLPLYDENPTYRRPYITYILIATNALMFIYMLMIEYALGPYKLTRFYYDWAVIPYYVWKGERLYTLITSMFMHAGFLHFGGNMLYLYIFGNNVEDSMGHGKFFIFYIMCGIVASYAQIMTNPTSTIPNLGASGAIAGVLGAYLITFPKAKVMTLVFYFIIRIPAVIVLGFWFVLQLFGGIGSLAVQGGGGVAYFAHIGGFVCGLILVFIFRKRNFKSKKMIEEDWDRVYYR
ncbi:MAG: rhomboid family intramembrane serine protease [Candidatus Methanofastidiosia archaeon]